MSLIGMHSAARDGFTIPSAPVKWKYLKGSEKDFADAPNDCVLVIKCNSDGKKYHLDNHYNATEIERCGDDVIARRQPITKADVEVAKYDPTKVDGEQRVKCGELKIDGEWHKSTINKYTRDCKGVQVDVYDVLQAFDVTNPALQHLIKKALCVGIRGHKTKQQDLQDIIDSAIRAKELEQ